MHFYSRSGSSGSLLCLLALSAVSTSFPVNDVSVVRSLNAIPSPDQFLQVSAPYVNAGDASAVFGMASESSSLQALTEALPLSADIAAQTSSTWQYTPSEIAQIMFWVNHFDKAYKIPHKTWSNTLFNNAQRTGKLDNGTNENHYLFPGTMAQVIINGLNLNDTKGYSYAPFKNFQAAYMDFLCECPKDPQLNGQCPKVLGVTCENVSGTTGHHDILTYAGYTKIGCAFTYRPGWQPNQFTHGLWVCDLA